MPVETQWRQRGPLVRFFTEHRRCGHGFDLGHPGGSGSGNLRARCRGCGAEISYLAGAEEPLETAPDVIPERGRDGGAEQARTRAEGVARKQGAWRSLLATGAIVLVVLAFATFVVAQLSTNPGPEKPSGGNEQVAGSTPPSTAAPAVAAPPVAGAETSKGNTHGAPGKRRSLAESGASISVPRRWDVNYADGGFVVAPSGSSKVAVCVYFRRGAPMDRRALRDWTRNVLEKEHPGATLTTEGPLISGSDGKSAVATYDTGFERAQSVIENGLAILVTARANNRALPLWQEEVLEIAASVRG
jgi:hypothetical protein